MAAITREAVAQIYVGTFNRAPDAAGLDYWVNQSGLTDIEQVAESFFDQPETHKLYDNLNNIEFVSAIYHNLFNRDADDAGLNYWVGQLESGAVTPGQMILAIENGALGQDKAIVESKTEIGLYFAEQGLDDVSKAYEILKPIDGTPEQEKYALRQIDEWAQLVGDFELTIGADDIKGTAADETIAGKVDADNNQSTYTKDDKIDGAGGFDTLKIQIETNTATTIDRVPVTNVEKLNLYDNSVADADVTVDFRGFDASFKDVLFYGTNQGTATLDQVKGVLDNIELAKEVKATNTINYTANAISGMNDSSTVVDTSTEDQRLQSNGIEKYTIHSESGSKSFTLEDLSTQVVKIDGDANLDFDVFASAPATTSVINAMSIDASALTGNFTFDPASVTFDVLGNPNQMVQSVDNASLLDLKSGSGNDLIRLGDIASTSVSSVCIETNDGNDTINEVTMAVAPVAAFTKDSLLKIDMGAGLDVLTLNKGSDFTRVNMFQLNTGEDCDRVTVSNFANVGTSSASAIVDLGGDSDTFSLVSAFNGVGATQNATIQLSAGSGNDIVNMTSVFTAAATGATGEAHINIDAGSGDDAFTLIGVASGAKTDDSDFFIDLGEGNDRLTMISVLTGSTAATGTVGTIIGGEGNDVIDIRGIGNPAGTSNTAVVRIDAGEGVDIITLSAVPQNEVLFFDNKADTGIHPGEIDFVNGFILTEDVIDIDTMAAGATGVNYTEVTTTTVLGNSQVGYDAALAAADKQFNANNSLLYVFATDGTDGWLFVDNDDVTGADMAIMLRGLNNVTQFADTNIIA